jgi:hypothetical protein
MKTKRNNYHTASALQIALALAIISVLGAFFASTFKAAPLSRSPAAARRPAASASALVPVLPEGCVDSYSLTIAGRKFVAAVDDIGNHCDDCGT